MKASLELFPHCPSLYQTYFIYLSYVLFWELLQPASQIRHIAESISAVKEFTFRKYTLQTLLSSQLMVRFNDHPLKWKTFTNGNNTYHSGESSCGQVSVL